MSRIILTIFSSILFLYGNILAQGNWIEDAKKHLLENSKELNLTSADFENMIVADAFSSKHNGAKHVYFQQSKEGIPVYNALINLTLTKNGNYYITANRFIPDLANKIKSNQAGITPEESIKNAFVYFVPTSDRNIFFGTKQIISKDKFTFKDSNISDADIPVNLTYVPDLKQESVILCWNLELDLKENADYWNVNVDANSGEILSKSNFTSYCNFNFNSFNHKSSHKHDTTHPDKANENRLLEASGSRYKVFPFPGESPNHIEHTILESPEDDLASPFGWHDDNGEEGHEYTITKGNNVHAYLDEFDNGSPSGPEPDGGDSLTFIFDFDPLAEPSSLKELAVVNLFYTNNRIHDLMYKFGFDEASGNFQTNNYGNGGEGDDQVHAQAFDGGGDNNANFSTPSDGGNGRMQMYLWSGGEGLRLEIHEPIEIGGLFETDVANFGLNMDINTVDGKVVLSQDDTNKPNLGCGTMVNIDELTGNIALIDRGVCEFGSKVLHAEEAGAIAVLICNVEGVNGGTGEELTTMGEGDEGDQVSIPSLFLKKSTCDLIKVAISNEQEVQVTMGLQQLEGPSQRAGSFDNGVVAHEYAHGISNRLTGGPNNSGCLYNADVNGDGEPDGEQMGEGWSDFYALVFTTKEEDLGDDARGIGTYVSGQQTSGRGIRHYPYSTDMNISPVTYDFIKTTNIPHGVGEVWAAAIWDLYWEFINLYGFDPSWSDENAGNYMAVQLVTDGLKFQACNPGFLDGRDAILDADQINYAGEHECLIWDVFSRRGMGYFATQGDPFDHRDGIENFDSKPNCLAELKIKESSEGTIVPGEQMSITLKVTNHKAEAVSNVIITEVLPNGLSYVEGSANYPVTQNDNELSISIGDMAINDELDINYILLSDPGIYSTRSFHDVMEEDDGNWFGLNNVGFDAFWELSDIASETGNYSWYIEEVATETDASLIMLFDPILIEGEIPALSFYHSYNSEVLSDGGFIEYSTDEGDTWNQFESEDFILNSYTGALSYNTIAIPGLEAFYGNSNGFIRSYIDLSSLKDQEVMFSYRYGSDDNTVVEGENPGWYIDEMEIVDLKYYTRVICVSSAENDNACTNAKVLIDSKLPDSVLNPESLNARIAIGPNPSNGSINLFVESPYEEDAKITMYDLNGKTIKTQKLHVLKGSGKYNINAGNLEAGSYILFYQTISASKIMKVIIE